nr:putative ribonuclease h protein [Quercus suber]
MVDQSNAMNTMAKENDEDKNEDEACAQLIPPVVVARCALLPLARTIMNFIVYQQKQAAPWLLKTALRKLQNSFSLPKAPIPTVKKEMPLSWVKPNPGWHKLNTDASVLSSSNYASGRGLLRDSCGSWVKGFSRKIGTSSYLLAELWALKDGLSMARNMYVENSL